MKYQIIFNPMACNQRSKKHLDLVCAKLDAAGLEYVIHKTEAKGHAEKIAREISKEHVNIITVGGDGTIHEVLNGISSIDNVNIAMVPAGTGNDFCGGMGVTTEYVMDAVIEGRIQPTDFIEFDNRLCINVGGLGIDVDVMEHVIRGRFKGRLKYTWCLLKSVFSYKPEGVKVKSGDFEYEGDAYIVAVCNGCRLGGGMMICPPAEVDDNKIEVVIVKGMGVFKLIKAASKLFFGDLLTDPNVIHFVCEEVDIEPHNACTIQLDGELYRNNEHINAKVRQGVKVYR